MGHNSRDSPSISVPCLANNAMDNGNLENLSAQGNPELPSGQHVTPSPEPINLPVLHTQTPLIRSTELSHTVGADVYLKLDNLQPSSSFKARGVGYMCREAVANGAKHLVSSSGGNAGLAAAYAGALFKTKTTIVVPDVTPTYMINKLRSEGATVEIYGTVWNEAHERALEIVKSDKSAVIIHPFDHPTVWQGHATIVEEIKEELHGQKPSIMILSVGGGGFLAGVCEGLHRVGWEDVPVLAVETEGSKSLHLSMKNKANTAIEKIDTVAKSLGALKLAEKAFEWSQIHPMFSCVVTDEEAIDACRRFADDQRLVVEPACGATLAAVYGNKLPEHRDEGKTEKIDYQTQPIVVLVCGGFMTRGHQPA